MVGGGACIVGPAHGKLIPEHYRPAYICMTVDAVPVGSYQLFFNSLIPESSWLAKNYVYVVLHTCTCIVGQVLIA